MLATPRGGMSESAFQPAKKALASGRTGSSSSSSVMSADDQAARKTVPILYRLRLPFPGLPLAVLLTARQLLFW